MVVERLGQWMRHMRAVTRSEEGQAMVEYALLISLIAIVGAGAVQLFGLTVAGLYSQINSLTP